MKKMIRKVALLAVVLVLIVGICAPAFAAVKPYVRLVSRPSNAYRGYWMYHKYYLYSGSYTYRSGWRANYDGHMYRRATGKCYQTWDRVFSGRGYETLKTKVTYSWPRGSYRTYVRCWYRSRGYGRWYLQGTMNWYFNVR